MGAAGQLLDELLQSAGCPVWTSTLPTSSNVDRQIIAIPNRRKLKPANLSDAADRHDQTQTGLFVGELGDTNPLGTQSRHHQSARTGLLSERVRALSTASSCRRLAPRKHVQPLREDFQKLKEFLDRHSQSAATPQNASVSAARTPQVIPQPQLRNKWICLGRSGTTADPAAHSGGASQPNRRGCLVRCGRDCFRRRPRKVFVRRRLRLFLFLGSPEPSDQHFFPPGLIDFRARIDAEKRHILGRDAFSDQVRLELRPIDHFLRGIPPQDRRVRIRASGLCTP